MLGPLFIVCGTSAEAMTISEFLDRAAQLEAKGPMALFSSDIGVLKSEVKTAGQAYRQDIAAARKAGRPAHSCPPAKAALNSNDLLSSFRAVPPEQRGMSVKAGFYAMMKKRYPCPA